MSTTKGKPLLVDNKDHKYRKQRLSADKKSITWICLIDGLQNIKCRAKIFTDLDFKILSKTGQHTHPPREWK